MNLSHEFGGKTSDQEQKPAIEYTAQAASPVVNGEVKLTFDDAAVTAASLFDVIEIPYYEINALSFQDYVVTIRSDSGDYSFSRMGEWAQRFYDALYDAYNKAVLRSLLIKGSPIVTAKGNYRFCEKTMAVDKNSNRCTGRDMAADNNNRYCENDITINSGVSQIHVYDDCVVSLPPDLSARRAPLCFVTGLEKGDYELTIRIDDESYSYAKLGYDTVPFADAIEKRLRELRRKSLAAVKEIDSTLTASQESQIAKLTPLGAAASIGRLAAIAPSFTAALEVKLSNSRNADYYQAFKELCDPAQLYVGFRKAEKSVSIADESTIAASGLSIADESAIAASGVSNAGESAIAASGLSNADKSTIATGGVSGAVFSGLSGNGILSDAIGKHMNGRADDKSSETPPPTQYSFWLIAPSPSGQYAAVEFAEADAATFVYKTCGDFDSFARRLNRALEAINFKREVIRLSDEELRKPEYIDYYMTAKRTASLQFIRANYVKRIIHSNPEAWKRSLIELWN